MLPSSAIRSSRGPCRVASTYESTTHAPRPGVPATPMTSWKAPAISGCAQDERELPLAEREDAIVDGGFARRGHRVVVDHPGHAGGGAQRPELPVRLGDAAGDRVALPLERQQGDSTTDGPVTATPTVPPRPARGPGTP